MDSKFIFSLVGIILFIILCVGMSKKARYHNKNKVVDERIVQDYGEPSKTLYLSTKVLTLHADTDITDENDNLLYHARTKFFTLHDCTRIYDSNKKEIAYVWKKFFTLHERRIVKMSDGKEFQLSNELFHLIKDITDIEGLGWKLEGNLLQLNFTIKDNNGEIIAVIGQKYLSLHDKYSVDIYDESKEEYIVAILISLQHMIRERRTSSRTAANANKNTNN